MKNFFDHQDRARRQSGRLIVLFSLALLGILSSTYLVSLFVVNAYGLILRNPHTPAVETTLWHPLLFTFNLLIVLAVTGLAALHRLRSLRGGGAAVAEMLGARQIGPGTQDGGERQLIHVVEEMALAAGIPVPPVYLLEEESAINAFAAGYSPNDAVVTVTQGLLDCLNRDEIQGVIGHELGHVLSGDMRLKCKLIAALFGISALALIGRVMFQVLPRMRFRKKEEYALAALLALAAGMLMLIGFLGLFMGRAIKAAVSRQREYLADASAVQFTRNPSGLAEALKKIARNGSRLRSTAAQELSHLFFAASEGVFISRLLATHPPLEKRIGRLDPDFTLDDLLPEAPEAVMSVERLAPAGATGSGSEPGDVVDMERQTRTLMRNVGILDPRLLAAAATAIDDWSPAMSDALSHPFSAAASLYAMLLVPEPPMRERQYSLIRKHSGAALLQETLRLEDVVERLAPAAVLPVANLALPVLRMMNSEQRNAFTVTIGRLIAADFKLSIREFAIALTVKRRLAASDQNVKRSPGINSHLTLRRETRVLLSVLSRAGHESGVHREAAFRAGMEFHEGLKRRLPAPLPEEESSLDALGQSLDLLAKAPLDARGKILEAGVRCILFDDKLLVEELELIQVLAMALDLPLGPVIAEKASSR